MAYAYGTQGAPAVGTGAPGLPQRSSNVGADAAGPPLVRIIVRSTDPYATAPFVTPDWATYCRVTAQGKGGRALGGLNGLALGATGAHGGAGSGLAATNIEPTPPGTPISITFDANATLVSFLSYQLSGGNGGDATSTAGGVAGIGSGGAINFNGGAGATATGSGNGGGGGGAAGRGGNGTSAINNAPGNSGPGDAYVTGGGAGGASANSVGSVSGSALSRTDASAIGALLLGFSTINPTNCNGGDGGGGAGGVAGGTISNVPGNPEVLIELW